MVYLTRKLSFRSRGLNNLGKSETYQVYKIENETGSGKMSRYFVFDGIYIVYEETHQIMNMFSINIEELKKRACGGSKYFIMRGNDSIQHIFSELYVVHDDVKLNYFKIRVIELLLFITTVDFDKNSEKKQYFMKNQVEIVKK